MPNDHRRYTVLAAILGYLLGILTVTAINRPRQPAQPTGDVVTLEIVHQPDLQSSTWGNIDRHLRRFHFREAEDAKLAVDRAEVALLAVKMIADEKAGQKSGR